MPETRALEANAKSNEELKAWLESDEGQKELARTLESGVNMCRELQRARAVTQESLRKPFTI